MKTKISFDVDILQVIAIGVAFDKDNYNYLKENKRYIREEYKIVFVLLCFAFGIKIDIYTNKKRNESI